MEYDNVYPPLNKPQGEGSDTEQPKKTALQMALDQAKDTKNVVIQVQDRKHKNLDDAFYKHLKSICEWLGIEVRLTLTNLGSLILNVKTNKTNFSEDQTKFLLKESLSKNVEHFVSLTPSQLTQLSDKRLQDRFTRNRLVSLKLDPNNERICISGGPTSVRLAEKEIDEFICWNSDPIVAELNIPQSYHYYICGPDSTTLDRIIESSGKFVKACINPKSPDVILLTGNRKCVENAKSNILALYEKYRRSYQSKMFSLTIAQHRIFSSLNLMDKMKAEGLPVVENKNADDHCSISVAGETETLDIFSSKMLAFLKRYTESRISCSYWVCMFFKLFTNFKDSLDEHLPGASFEVNPRNEELIIMCDESQKIEACAFTKKVISDIVRDATYDLVIANDDLYRGLTSNNSKNLREIEVSSTSNIIIDTNFDKLSILTTPVKLPNRLCTIIGVPTSVHAAKEKLIKLQDFYNSFQTTTMAAPNHLHRYLIGTKGKSLNELINNHGPNCSISFGKESPNLDICTAKGPESELSTLMAALEVNIKKCGIEHHRNCIEIPDSIRNMLLKNRASLINRIRNLGKLDSYNVPTMDNKDKYITLIGPKDVVDKSSQYIDERIKELSISVTKQINIPESLIPLLNKFNDVILTYVVERVGGGINMQLPRCINTQERITIFGLQKNVDAAIAMLRKCASNDSSDCHVDYVDYPSRFTTQLSSVIFNFMRSADVRSFFMSPSTNLTHSILLIGNAVDVESVKKSIVDEVETLENTVEKTILIKGEYKKEFLRKRGDQATLVHKLSSQFGNAHIVIGERTPDSDAVTVSVSGNSANVDKLIKEINRLVSQFDRRVEESVEFTLEALRLVMEGTRYLLKNTMSGYNVTISISDNYYQPELPSDGKNKCRVSVRGMPEDVEKAVEAVKEWKIVKETVEFPHHNQRFTFGPTTNIYYTLTNHWMVTLELGCTFTPPADTIVVSGVKSNVEDAVEYIKRLCEDNYEQRLRIPNKYFTRLIGKQGAAVKKFNHDYGVRLSIPNRDTSDEVIISGKRKNCIDAVQQLNAMVEEWENIVNESFEFDARARMRLVGQNNVGLNTIGREFNTRIWLLGAQDKNPRTRVINISGLTENVSACKLRLEAMVEEILDEVEEQWMYQPPSHDDYYTVDIAAITSTNKVSQKRSSKHQNHDPNINETHSGNHINKNINSRQR